MKKTMLVGALSLFAVLSLVGCGNNSNTYEIAVVTDVGQLKDGGFNQGTYEGAETYAKANNKTYKYYQPANGSDATDNDRIAAYNLAVQNGAKIIVAPGYLQATAMRTVAKAHTDVKFVFVDGWSLTDSVDEKGNDNGTALKNVTAITYKEQEAGYFAGYGAAMDGFTKLGGTFGGGGTNPACERYAWGYVQGIEAGAAAKGVTSKLEVKVSYKYSSSFSASTELKTQIDGWYSSGTEVVFCCGGSMVNSVVAAVGSATNRYIIGVDTDQANLSNQVITSAMKGLGVSVQKILGQYYGNTWDADLAAKTQNLGAADDATGLPTATTSWRFRTFTVEQYTALFNKVKAGTVTPNGTVPEDINDATWWSTNTASMSHITVTLDK
jgi:basic membrane protein A